MFMVPGFRPGIGEEDEDPRNGRTQWESIDEESRVSVDEMEVLQLCSIAFAHCASDSLPDDVDSDADLVKVLERVRGEKMAMP